MSFDETFLGFLVALAAGSLIGLERQQDKRADQRQSLGGVRTFPLIALCGALSSLVAQIAGIWVLVGGLLIIGMFLGISFYQEWVREHYPGITTPTAALITFLLGALALLPGLALDTSHRYLLIVASAAVVMAVLSFKEPLHKAITHVSDDDIYATAKFVILVLVVLPLLPNRPIGPLEILNPFHIGLMVVFIAGISFLGYLLTRLFGAQKGIVTTGLVGGLVSSTAVTLSMAHHVRKSPKAAKLAAFAILGASSTMFARMLVIVGILDVNLLRHLFWPLGMMMVAGYGSVFALYLKSDYSSSEGTSVAYRNPFELTAALEFGLLYAAVLFISKGAQTWFGDMGLYASSLVAGASDVDAITLSLTQFHLEGLDSRTATLAIMAAAVANSFAKLLLAGCIGKWVLAKHTAPIMVGIIFVGLGVFAFSD